MKDILNKITWAYQRARYGYDERIMWGFDDYFETFLTPLKKFCEQKLEYEGFVKYNEEKAEILRETIKRIDTYKEDSRYESQTALWAYVGNHIGIYWD